MSLPSTILPALFFMSATEMISISAAHYFTSHYYTTATVAEADISCEIKAYHKESEFSCAHECNKVGCYKFVFKNGLCNITERVNSLAVTQRHDVFYRRVRAAFSSLRV